MLQILKHSVVIGLGSMGRRRIRLLKLIYPDMQITGVDKSRDRCQQAETEYQVDTVCHLEELEHALDIGCAFVCTSPLSHGGIITNCLKMGWHVFSEINLVSDLYQENIRLAEEKNLVLYLSSTPLYRDEMKAVHSLMEHRENPVTYTYHVGQYLPDWHPWENPSDFFVSDIRTNGCRELMAIELPWIRKVFGKIHKINGMAGRFTNQGPNCPDCYQLNLVHENGNMGSLCIDTVCPKALRELRIFGEGFYCEWNGTPQSLKVKQTDSQELIAVKLNDSWQEAGYREFINESAYLNEIKDFFAVLSGKKEPEYTFKDDIKTLSIMDEIEGIWKNESLYGRPGFYRETSFQESK